MVRALSSAGEHWRGNLGRTRQEALCRINELVGMIVQELIQDGKPLPEGPENFVDVEELSQHEPRIAGTV